MPFPRSWLPRIRSIVAAVEDWPAEHLDREAIAQVFALKRRAALSLMKEIGPIRLRTGRWILPREKLIAFLQAQAKEAEVELARKERFTQSLLAADASLLRRPSILLAPRTLSSEQREAYAVGLPESVTLELGSPNRLVVEFATIEELAERLLATGIALNNRFSVYQDLFAPQSQAAHDEDQAEREDAEYLENWRPD
ncbi:hypothetical protein [Acidisarcina polymorpha]|uniref:hypothetical protein n=1 Tax=Acidisarcina polymorpha TaxID=2211140 RepID=UPI000DEF5FE8|nr:hypothetical protein [Acidisarcina polymorpha]